MRPATSLLRTHSLRRLQAGLLTPQLPKRFSTAIPRADGDLIPLKNRFSLAGKSYIVTGGGRGIGYAAARAIAEVGGNVSILDQARSPVRDFASLASEFGVKTKYIRTDITQEASVSRAFEETMADFGRLDGCVTAAGICPEGDFTEHTLADVKRCFDVNITGTFLAAQQTTKALLAQNTPGSIVMIASISGSSVNPGVKLSAYSASKGAVRMLCTELGVELAPAQIRVNAISPGYIDTELLAPLKAAQPKRIDLMQNEPPMKRIGNRNDLTPAVVYLLSEASSYMTGSEIVIAGGVNCGRIESSYL
ncbi:putative short-chain dehydrogenase [Aspergillus pseudoustus]|uniref:Short-chain dehydrogenase n=1 Tax=Aspergillus pseudoustus TaxID=1810923 RepID=A0ABR4IK25_9EURO